MSNMSTETPMECESVYIGHHQLEPIHRSSSIWMLPYMRVVVIIDDGLCIHSHSMDVSVDISLVSGWLSQST
mgnify:CR=1 FL=1